MNTSDFSFREKIQAHRDAGTCYICGKPVIAGEEHHGSTGAHWACHKAEERETQRIIVRGDAAFADLGLKRRRREGEGTSATKAKAMAVAALAKALGTEIYDVTLWKQARCLSRPALGLGCVGDELPFRAGWPRVQRISEFSGDDDAMRKESETDREAR